MAEVYCACGRLRPHRRRWCDVCHRARRTAQNGYHRKADPAVTAREIIDAHPPPPFALDILRAAGALAKVRLE